MPKLGTASTGESLEKYLEEMRGHNKEGGALEIKAIATNSRCESRSTSPRARTSALNMPTRPMSRGPSASGCLWRTGKHYDWLERIPGVGEVAETALAGTPFPKTGVRGAGGHQQAGPPRRAPSADLNGARVGEASHPGPGGSSATKGKAAQKIDNGSDEDNPSRR